jgi:hypothetical protein
MNQQQFYQSPQPYGTPAMPPPRKTGRPGLATAIAIMTLVGGILACLSSAGIWLYLVVATCGFGLIWPGPYFGLVMGIMAIVKGTKLLNDHVGNETAPTGIAIMQIINIINCDVTNLVLGILTLTFSNSAECQAYYRGSGMMYK